MMAGGEAKLLMAALDYFQQTMWNWLLDEDRYWLEKLCVLGFSKYLNSDNSCYENIILIFDFVAFPAF